jgi:3-oxoacyl-[acyl-carrier protein] reductase
MFTSVAGRSVVVTGGSRGIGRGVAAVFARNGANVLITGRDESAARDAVQELDSLGPGSASYLLGDVSRPEVCVQMAATAQERHGGIDVVCANAGVYPMAQLLDMSESDMDQMYAINVKGTMLTVQACVAALAASGRGRVILISSITGPITGEVGSSHYGASKAAQLGFMRGAAIELAPMGITVNAVLPGNVMTEGLAVLGERHHARMLASIPIGRLGEAEEIGHAVLFLATDEASFITGQTLVVDGGQVLPESLAV